MKTILLNVTPEETRMVMTEDGRLTEMEVERPAHSHLVGNIYKGRVQNVLPGMQAASPRPAAAVGRNDPCPCGSGKKYKKCCGRDRV